MNNFATAIHYHFRQLFIYLCKKIIKNEKIFKDYVFHLFNDLSYDKIVNVRYTLSSFINKIWNKNKKEYEWIKNDKEVEVKKCLEKIDINEDIIEDKNKALQPKEVNQNFVGDFKDFKKLFDYEPIISKNSNKKTKNK